MIIIGFEDSDGKPVVKTEKEKEEFLKMMRYKKEEVMFADSTPSTVFIGLDLLGKGLEKTTNKE